MTRGAVGGIGGLGTLPARLGAGLVRCYQVVISPLSGPRCRFYPTCSAYALEAIRLHGLVRGVGLAARRIMRCNPWHPGGVDHVPAPSLAAWQRRGLEKVFHGLV
ncbi:MAG: membrane protein insertion efficiency factor YidD [Bifidobacteriaceae bacterium]|jgi:putative membrane protein insertion efficiency factor|nr:membrane protein insertion efficiency factor YidD [Bifidobacteriaceae bacterium]